MLLPAGFGEWVDVVRGLPDFAGVVEKADGMAQPEGVVFPPWHSQ